MDIRGADTADVDVDIDIVLEGRSSALCPTFVDGTREAHVAELLGAVVEDESVQTLWQSSSNKKLT